MWRHMASVADYAPPPLGAATRFLPASAGKEPARWATTVQTGAGLAHGEGASNKVSDVVRAGRKTLRSPAIWTRFPVPCIPETETSPRDEAWTCVVRAAVCTKTGSRR
jgi:hypothetical protein